VAPKSKFFLFPAELPEAFLSVRQRPSASPVLLTLNPWYSRAFALAHDVLMVWMLRHELDRWDGSRVTIAATSMIDISDIFSVSYGKTSAGRSDGNRKKPVRRRKLASVSLTWKIGVTAGEQSVRRGLIRSAKWRKSPNFLDRVV